MDDKIDNIKNLSPEERIKKLKELQEKNKKELNETEKLIKKSIQEMQIKKETEDIPIPEQEEININRLFESETIEDVVQKEKKEASEEELKAQTNYNVLTDELRRQSTENVMNKVENLYNQIKQTGYVSREQMNEAYAAAAVARERQNEIEKGNYVGTIGEKVADQINLTMGITNWIRNMYKMK
jgi:hypothetical protein